MCNLLKILKKLGSKSTVKDIEVNEPEVVQPKEEEVMQVKPIDINFTNLPTSATGLSTSDVWNDGGTLKIV